MKGVFNMKYYLSEFYKFKILIAISIILGAIAIPTVLSNFLKEVPSFKDSFKIITLNHETSLKYFLISTSLNSDTYTIELIIKPGSNNPNVVIPTFTTLFLSDEQMKILSKLIKKDELKLQKDINFFYKYPTNRGSVSVLQLILSGNLSEGDFNLIVNEVKFLLLKLGLDESDYYFDNKNLIERGALGSLEKFEAQVQQSDLQSKFDFSEMTNKLVSEKQFQDRLVKFSGTVESNFVTDVTLVYNLSGSNRQELTDFKLYMMDFLKKYLNPLPSKSLYLNYFLVTDNDFKFLVTDNDFKTETLQSDNGKFEHIVLGGLIGLFLSMIIIYVNALLKEVRKELKKSKRR
jgi:hypothetical protein